MARRALFVGVNDYAFEPLSSCLNDAVGMRDAFVRLGMVEDHESSLMTSPHVNGSVGQPTRGAILDWLLPYYEALEPIDVLFVYLSGHGLAIRLEREADALRTVFVPAGVRGLANSGEKLIDLDELIGRFRRRGAREQLWIIDACRNLPEKLLLNVATIGWDLPGESDPRDATLHAQAVIYAVAPLAKAQADRGARADDAPSPRRASLSRPCCVGRCRSLR